MRAGSRGDLRTRAFAIVAVTPASQATPAVIEARFEAIGYEVKHPDNLRRNRSDRAPVICAYHSTNVSERAFHLVTAALIAAVALSSEEIERQRAATLTSERPSARLPKAMSFQPVWNVRAWASTGLELLAADDEDACAQLGCLAEALDFPRERLTIKPRVGWCGYGHPDIQRLG